MGMEQFISRVPRMKFAIDSVVPDLPAQKAGLVKGDSIVAVNAAPVVYFDQLQAQLQQYKNKQVQLTIKHNDSVYQKSANISKDGVLGFFPKTDLPKEKRLTFGFFGSLPVGATKAWGTFTDNAKGLGKVFKGEVKFNKAVSGPVAIATMFGSHIDWIRFWSLVGFLSMVLALTNLLPIPALDGGHALFLVIEMIKGKPLSDKFLERAQIVGFVILITLMVFVFGNDIVKQVMKK
ncbi:MAG: M50 family metallopeptidase, partial [Mucilaginibacter sp.]